MIYELIKLKLHQPTNGLVKRFLLFGKTKPQHMVIGAPVIERRSRYGCYPKFLR